MPQAVQYFPVDSLLGASWATSRGWGPVPDIGSAPGVGRLTMTVGLALSSKGGTTSGAGGGWNDCRGGSGVGGSGSPAIRRRQNQTTPSSAAASTRAASAMNGQSGIRVAAGGL